MAVFNLPVFILSDRTAPVISIPLGNSTSIDEDVSPGSLIATVQDDGTAVSYALDPNTTTNPGSDIALNTSTGDITVANALDYETTTTYTLGITATDALGNTSNPLIFTVNINDIDEIAPVVTKTNSYFASIDEDNNNQLIATFEISDNGVPITSGATMSATPNDTNFTLTYDSGNAEWQLKSAASGRLGGGVGSDQTFVFTISYTDSVNLTGSATHTLTVLDIDAPTITKTSLQTSVPEKPSSNTDIVEFVATSANGSNVSSNLSISYSPNGTGFSSYMDATNTKKIVRVNAGAYVGGGAAETNTNFVITATGTVSGSSSTLTHSVEVIDKSTITGGTYIGGPSSTELSNFQNSSMSPLFNAAASDGTKLYLFDINNGDRTYILEVDLATGRFGNSGTPYIRDMPPTNLFSPGDLGTNLNHRDIAQVWVDSSRFWVLSKSATHNGYNAPLIWRGSKTSTSAAHWDVQRQPANWTNNVSGSPDGSFLGPDGNVYLFDGIGSNSSVYRKLTNYDNSSASQASSSLSLNGVDDVNDGSGGVAVCSHSGNDTLIFLQNSAVRIVDFVGSSSKVGDLVQTDDPENLEDQISPNPGNLGASSFGGVAGSGSYFYIFKLDGSDYKLYRFNVSNAHNSE